MTRAGCRGLARLAVWGAAAWTLAGCAGSSAGVPTVRLDPLRAPPPGGDPLAVVGFMAGCWRTPAGAPGAALEERWSPPEGGVALGTSRFVQGGRTVSFEFGLIRAQEGGTLLLLPHPGGRPSEHAFLLTRGAPGEAVFEAPEHDYPRRIAYRRVDGLLEARIDAGADDPEPRLWRMEPVACH